MDDDDTNQLSSDCFEITTARVKSMIAYPDYQDFSVKGNAWLDNERLKLSSNPRRKVKFEQESFPTKLYRMLEHLESSGLSNVASFQPHGRAIRIHDRQQFQNNILQRYFPDNRNIESFQRQLNLYDFLRMKKSGADRDSYYHAMFLQGRPDLCSLMKRPLTSSYSKRQAYDPKTEPDFYAMPPISFLPDCFEENYTNANTMNEKERQHDEIPDRMLSRTNHDNDAAEIPTCKDYDVILGVTAHVNATVPEVSDQYLCSLKKRSIRSSSPFRIKSNIEIYGQEEVDSESNYSLSSSRYSTATVVSSSSRANATMTIMNTDCTATKKSSVPADVIAAAKSILAGPTLLSDNVDPSYAIVDQYCRNVAIKVLNDLNCCCPTSAELVATTAELGGRQQHRDSSRSSDDHRLHHNSMTNELNNNSSEPQPQQFSKLT